MHLFHNFATIPYACHFYDPFLSVPSSTLLSIKIAVRIYDNLTNLTTGPVSLCFDKMASPSMYVLVLCLLATSVMADVYLHMPRGSNNRLDDENR
jgi:hypothetical protein